MKHPPHAWASPSAAPSAATIERTVAAPRTFARRTIGVPPRSLQPSRSCPPSRRTDDTVAAPQERVRRASVVLRALEDPATDRVERRLIEPIIRSRHRLPAVSADALRRQRATTPVDLVHE